MRVLAFAIAAAACVLFTTPARADELPPFPPGCPKWVTRAGDPDLIQYPVTLDLSDVLPGPPVIGSAGDAADHDVVDNGFRNVQKPDHPPAATGAIGFDASRRAQAEQDSCLD